MILSNPKLGWGIRRFIPSQKWTESRDWSSNSLSLMSHPSSAITSWDSPTFYLFLLILTVLWPGISILPLISSSLTLFSRHLGTVPNAPPPVGITITFNFYSLLSYMARIYLFVCILFFLLYGPMEQQNPLDDYLRFNICLFFTALEFGI